MAGVNGKRDLVYICMQGHMWIARHGYGTCALPKHGRSTSNMTSLVSLRLCVFFVCTNFLHAGHFLCLPAPSQHPLHICHKTMLVSNAVLMTACNLARCLMLFAPRMLGSPLPRSFAIPAACSQHATSGTLPKCISCTCPKQAACSCPSTTTTLQHG